MDGVVDVVVPTKGVDVRGGGIFLDDDFFDEVANATPRFCTVTFAWLDGTLRFEISPKARRRDDAPGVLTALFATLRSFSDA